MPKFYDKKKPQSAVRINEDQWFDLFQPLLLKIINTPSGRELLHIKDYPYKAILIRKNCVHFDKGNGEYVADFRVGAKWANVIRYKWHDFQVEAKKHYQTYYEGGVILSPVLHLNGKLVASNAVDTFYPDPNPETTTVDGLGVQSSNAGTWAITHDLTSSNQAFDDGTSIFPRCDVNAGFPRLYRGFMLYDTSSLGASATVSAVQISLYGHGKSGSSTMGIVQSNPASNTAITTADFDAFTVHEDTATATIDSASFSITGYNDLSFDATGLTWINTTGITKLGARMIHDYSDTITHTNGNPSGTNTNMQFRSADQTGTSQDPALEVTYSAAATFIPKVMWL